MLNSESYLEQRSLKFLSLDIFNQVKQNFWQYTKQLKKVVPNLDLFIALVVST